MMPANIPTPIVLVIGGVEKHEKLLNNWREYQHQQNFRAIKKSFSRDKPALLVAYVTNEDDQALAQKVIEYIRSGLSNQDTRIVLIREPEIHLDEVDWLENLQINGCLVAEENKQTFNLSVLNRELETFQHINNYHIQHNAETDMLMCIAQFSRDKEPLSELLKKFSTTLSRLCYSTCGFHIKIDNNQTGEIRYSDIDIIDLKEDITSVLGLPQLPDYLKNALLENQPQINLLPESIQLQTIEEKLNTKIGSYLTFPISAYNKVIYLLFYLIPEDAMDKVSMKQINVMNKAFDQLTMLLERRQAETSLKKQYQRLKHALVELKSTQEELKTKEKMASIGQMAAGIAHEINNPLSFVISNFSSLDNYLNSIMELQQLQAEFLSSIEAGQHQEISSLKKNISDFEEEQDIPFILEDIRAVVSDSHNGLQRVKNIINDLKSFTYSQSTELEACNLNKVIDDSLKILKYDINESITVEKNIEVLPEFRAHDGLLQQVFTNLIKNAAQAMIGANTPNPSITLTAKPKGKTVVISVKDNGPGIPKEAQKKIFEPFYTTKTVGEGTGLGLSVTFNIIKKLGGEIVLNSQEGCFTEFVISFKTKEN